jgi:hypothetical protein
MVVLDLPGPGVVGCGPEAAAVVLKDQLGYEDYYPRQVEERLVIHSVMWNWKTDSGSLLSRQLAMLR